MASDSNYSRDASSPTELDQANRPLGRSIVALCILGVGGQLFTEISGTFFSTIIHFGAGIPYKYTAYMNAAFLILGVVCYILFGAISDNLRTRFGRRMPLVFIGVVSTAVLTYLFTVSTNFLWLFIDGGILIAITNSMTRVSSSLTADLLPQEKRGRINTLLTVMTPIGSVIVWIPSLVSLISNNGSFSGESSIVEFDATIGGAAMWEQHFKT
ncbi:MAG TPA: MFS transporter [Candidatus Lokiarchaeia archaeon]|nr:MFS transporter [Candidatus Lokiarchaeia archaeon]